MNLRGKNEHGGDDSWGGEAQWDAQWGGDQWGGQGDYEPALRSVEARYGPALASLRPAAVETTNNPDGLISGYIEIAPCVLTYKELVVAPPPGTLFLVVRWACVFLFPVVGVCFVVGSVRVLLWGGLVFFFLWSV